MNFVNTNPKQKSLIYSNILSRKRNIYKIFEVLKIKLNEKVKTDKNNELEL